ncbi:MAG TPA: hypothetical protein VFY23_15335 [Candidatus Limnocylindrales bacterium]|nr:hypothetical protein [Candidatus Limnocylindrales bacterium]
MTPVKVIKALAVGAVVLVIALSIALGPLALVIRQLVNGMPG